MREVYDTFPFRVRKDAVEALRRCLERRAIVVLEVGTVPPGTAYTNVGRPKRGREFVLVAVAEGAIMAGPVGATLPTVDGTERPHAESKDWFQK
jgi:hypothetical protein